MTRPPTPFGDYATMTILEYAVRIAISFFVGPALLAAAIMAVCLVLQGVYCVGYGLAYGFSYCVVSPISRHFRGVVSRAEQIRDTNVGQLIPHTKSG